MKKISIKKIAQLTGHKGGVFSLTQSYPNHLFLSGAGDGWIVEWDLTKPKDGALIALAEDTQTGGKASIFSLLRTTSQKEGGGEIYIAGNMNGGLHWIYPKAKNLNKDVLHHKKGVFDIQFFDKNEKLILQQKFEKGKMKNGTNKNQILNSDTIEIAFRLDEEIWKDKKDVLVTRPFFYQILAR